MLARTLFLALVLLLPPAMVRAQDIVPTLVEPGDEVMPGTRYADLLSQLFETASAGPDGMTIGPGSPLPHIEGPDFAVSLEAPVALQGLQAARVPLGGREHLVLLAQLGASDAAPWPVAMLGVFTLDGSPTLVDAADVAADRLVGFGTPMAVASGADDHLLVISNRHGNAGQFYDATSLIELSAGKLRLVDVVLLLSDMGCQGNRTQSLRLEPVTSTGNSHWPVVATVTDELTAPDAACDTEVVPNTENYSVTYGWSEAEGGYRAEGDGWAALDAINEARF